MTRNQSSLAPLEARLLAILEADGGWLDRPAIAYRYNQQPMLSQYHARALQRLADWGWVEVQQQVGPRGRPRYLYRYRPTP